MLASKCHPELHYSKIVVVFCILPLIAGNGHKQWGLYINATYATFGTAKVMHISKLGFFFAFFFVVVVGSRGKEGVAL